MGAWVREFLCVFTVADLAPAFAEVAEARLDVDLVAVGDDDFFAEAREEAREAAGFVHDLVGAFDEHGHDVRGFWWFEDESADAPFEVAHVAFVGLCLVDEAFGEDVDPGVGITGVP